MNIIIGLGNPGKEYEGTRHNFGFAVVDGLADEWGLKFKNSRFKALLAAGEACSRKILLVKPQTFMNVSGEALQAILGFYRESPANCLAVYDDLDLELGRIKFAPNGSAAGHRGVQSLIDQSGSRDFNRLRLGIGRPAGPIPVTDYVLSTWDNGDEADKATRTALKAVEAIQYYLVHGIEKTMNRFN